MFPASLAVAGLALRHRARQGPGEGRLGDPGDRHTKIKSVLHRPATGALLLGLVEHDVDEGLAGLGVHMAEHLGGDLDQEGLKITFVPGLEDLADLGGARPGAPA